MKTLVCTEPGRFKYISAPPPAITEEQAIVKIRRIGICGTDLHAYEGTQPYFSYPRILGHELAGELVTDHPEAGCSRGEAVTFLPYFNCGRCIACRAGKSNCCAQLQVCGVHIDGGMTEYFAVPSRLLVRGAGLSFDELALVESLSIGAHGIRRAGVCPGEYIMIIGAGPIGLGAIEFAGIAGARVIAMDINEQRLQFCKDRLDVQHTIHVKSGNITEQLKEITNGDMPTIVIDATGNLNAINHAFQYIAHGGRYVLIGLQKGDIVFSHPEFHKREATLMSSRNATREDFEQVIRSMKNGHITPTNYITHRVPFDNVADEFANWLDPAHGVIKAMVELN